MLANQIVAIMSKLSLKQKLTIQVEICSKIQIIIVIRL